MLAASFLPLRQLWQLKMPQRLPSVPLGAKSFLVENHCSRLNKPPSSAEHNLFLTFSRSSLCVCRALGWDESSSHNYLSLVIVASITLTSPYSLILHKDCMNQDIQISFSKCCWSMERFFQNLVHRPLIFRISWGINLYFWALHQTYQSESLGGQGICILCFANSILNGFTLMWFPNYYTRWWKCLCCCHYLCSCLPCLLPRHTYTQVTWSLCVLPEFFIATRWNPNL